MPEKIVTNHDLARLVETNDEWIRTRTGICRRHIVTGETLTSMSVDAAKKALAGGRARCLGSGYDYCGNPYAG